VADPVVELRRTNLAALAPLLDSDPVRRTAASRATAVTSFWTSRSAYLQLDRDDLAKLVSLAGIQAVYGDTIVHLPPVALARDLPAAVLEDSAASWGITATGGLATWGAYGGRGTGVTIGVLDTGVDPTHPDLHGKVAKWAEFDATGQPVPDSQPHDSAWHGTHVCGTIAGGNASGQWIGMAPEASLAVGLVLKGGSGTSQQVLAGIQWAVEQGVDVLSMSLGAAMFGPQAPSTYTDGFLTCLRAGIPVIVAMGNEGAETGGSTGSDIFAYAVGATDYRDVVAGFSGGQTEVITQSSIIAAAHLPLIYTKPDVSAPGVDVTSSVPGPSWKAANGTSMATPHVAGAVALLLSNVPAIRSELSGIDRAVFIEDILTGSADELGEAGHDARYGFGRLNILRAVALAKQSPSLS
jgi:subtilisin family serine protease